jgi:ubiquinone/menaquinone biosynthesis C-methylase UbiE
MDADEQKSANLIECTIDNQWVQYFEDAEPHMAQQWEKLIWPAIREFDFTTTLELAPGGGRNSVRLIPLSRKLHLVDVNQYCIDLCKERFKDHTGPATIHYHVNDGTSLAMIESGSVSAIYTWDSAVHMDKFVIRDYLVEFSRVLAQRGKVFLHHSNYGTISDSVDFKKNPHWRSNMSAAHAKDYASNAGLTVLRQQIIPWGGDTEALDCISILAKP